MTVGREIMGKKACKRKVKTGKKHNMRACKKEATTRRKKRTHAEKEDLTTVGLGFFKVLCKWLKRPIDTNIDTHVS
jgi:hypothetical protein